MVKESRSILRRWDGSAFEPDSCLWIQLSIETRKGFVIRHLSAECVRSSHCLFNNWLKLINQSERYFVLDGDNLFKNILIY